MSASPETPAAEVPVRATDEERLARLALTVLAEPGSAQVSRLVQQLGARPLLAHLLTDQELSGLRDDVQQRLVTVDPERVLRQGERLGLRYVVPGDDEWPAGLDDLYAAPVVEERGGPPLGLWVRGPLRLDALTGGVAVVGSRNATTYGTEVAASLAAGVADTGRTVVSGGAYGIDVAAHRGALATGTTVAVLACGADRSYPADHVSLFRHLAETSAVISETPPGSAPTRGRFLARNRLISALTRGTVVVEAAIRSGALSSANWASRLNRPVMAVPGPVTSAQSQGTNHLVRGGVASLVTSADDVLELVAQAGEHVAVEPRAPERPRDRLAPREKQVLDAVPLMRPAQTDAVARTSGIALMKVPAILARLLKMGLVEQLPEGWRLTEQAQR